MRKIFSVVGLLFLLISPISLSQEGFAEIDSGIFLITIDGDEALYENLGLYRLPDGTYELMSTIIFSLGESQATRLQRLHYDENYLPLDY